MVLVGLVRQERLRSTQSAVMRYRRGPTYPLRIVQAPEVPIGSAICGPKPGVRVCRSVGEVGKPTAESGRSLSCARPPTDECYGVKRRP
jgi:hypothetical protein